MAYTKSYSEFLNEQFDDLNEAKSIKYGIEIKFDVFDVRTIKEAARELKGTLKGDVVTKIPATTETIGGILNKIVTKYKVQEFQVYVML
jgi:hypothetical protein